MYCSGYIAYKLPTNGSIRLYLYNMKLGKEEPIKPNEEFGSQIHTDRSNGACIN